VPTASPKKIFFIFLNACDTEEIGQEILDKNITGHVICVKGKIDDTIACWFSPLFYKFLTRGLSFCEAFT
jgi:hypothetical protein